MMGSMQQQVLEAFHAPVGLPQVCEGSVHCILLGIHGAGLHLRASSVC
jgi:hypothetical protein